MRDRISRRMRFPGDAITLKVAQLSAVGKRLLLPVAGDAFQSQPGIRIRKFTDGPGKPLRSSQPASCQKPLLCGKGERRPRLRVFPAEIQVGCEVLRPARIVHMAAALERKDRVPAEATASETVPRVDPASGPRSGVEIAEA